MYYHTVKYHHSGNFLTAHLISLEGIKVYAEYCFCTVHENRIFLYETGKGFDDTPSIGDVGESALHQRFRILHLRGLV
jgi:hypothetical protein